MGCKILAINPLFSAGFIILRKHRFFPNNCIKRISGFVWTSGIATFRTFPSEFHVVRIQPCPTRWEVKPWILLGSGPRPVTRVSSACWFHQKPTYSPTDRIHGALWLASEPDRLMPSPYDWKFQTMAAVEYKSMRCRTQPTDQHNRPKGAVADDISPSHSEPSDLARCCGVLWCLDLIASRTALLFGFGANSICHSSKTHWHCDSWCFLCIHILHF